MTDSYRLILGNCLDVLPRLYAEGVRVDAIITDPPYSSGGLFRGDRARQVSAKYLSARSRTSKRWPDFAGDNRDGRSWAFWATMWLTRCWEMTRPGGWVMVFTDWRQLPTLTDALQAAGYVWRGVAVWDKGRAVRPNPGRFSHQAEFVVWGTRGAAASVSRKARTNPGLFRHPSVPSARRLHPVEKPVSVLRWLIRVVPAGGTILDPFAGSGSTGVAALTSGRKFIGIEMDEGYYETARERLEKALLQPLLFADAGEGAEEPDVNRDFSELSRPAASGNVSGPLTRR